MDVTWIKPRGFVYHVEYEDNYIIDASGITVPQVVTDHLTASAIIQGLAFRQKIFRGT